MKKTHKRKQIPGIVPGLGGWQSFVYALFWGVIPSEGEKRRTKYPQNPVKVLFMCLFGLRWFVSLPNITLHDLASA